MYQLVPGNAQHIGSRESQQDSFGFSDLTDKKFVAHGGFVAIVADGMGGLAHGDAASRTAVRTFLDAYGAKGVEEPVPQALRRAVTAANEAVYARAQQMGMPGDIGTTLVAAVFIGGKLFWISVGDSGIYLFRRGEITPLNTGHTYSLVLEGRVLRGELSAEEAAMDAQRESLTSYVGTPDLKEIDRSVRPFPLEQGDMVVLGSDGLFKSVPDEEIAEILRTERRRAPDMLVKRTLDKKREHQDNVTVLTVGVETAGSLAATRKLEAAPAELPETVEMKKPELEKGDPAPPRSRSWAWMAMLAVVLCAAGTAYWLWFRPVPKRAPNLDLPRPTTGGVEAPIRQGDAPGPPPPVDKLDPSKPVPPPPPPPQEGRGVRGPGQ